MDHDKHNMYIYSTIVNNIYIYIYINDNDRYTDNAYNDDKHNANTDDNDK